MEKDILRKMFMVDEFNLDIPRMGYFILYKSDGSFLSRQVEKEQRNEGFDQTDSQYTHIEVSGGGPDAVGAKWPKSKLLNIIKMYPGRYVKIVKYAVDEYDGRPSAKVAFFGATRSNLRYSILGALWHKLNNWILPGINPFVSKKHPICSYLCAWALNQQYPDAFEEPKNALPAHFLSNSKFQLVWEGHLPVTMKELESKKEEDK